MRGRDVIVFLHIQKTGGTTFGRHLVRNIHLEQPCYCRAGQKKCACHRPGGDKDTWLFSRFSTGWSCGLHADWTELTSCVPAAMERRGCAGNRTLRSVPDFQISARNQILPFGSCSPAAGRALSAPFFIK
ncbi:heparan-sulfate 6-O-sulfotransferase 3-like protein [Willisornis vidua]|uniref:Heparan-sulfate 6-O-sulfotransferase n=1 Tax=Willisornis vidua TaxID=1566151 RepID=A0ABQ9CJP2_9PASS|nr:heparan-sulfate 6-O-sulfotransferase 3-like protein [Willisornis vidua]